MKKVEKHISYFLKIGTLVSTAGLILSVLIQIYGRFLMENAPSWTEEASRMFFIYAVSFAAGIAYKQNYYVFLDLISSKLSTGGDHRLQVATNVLVFILFFIITVFSISFVSVGIGERSPSLGITMAYSFVSILLMASSICFFSIIKLIKLLNKR